MNNPINLWKIIVIGIGIFVTFQFYKNYLDKKQVLTKTEFKEYEKMFNAEIDTLNIKIDKANAKLDTVQIDIDTLKNYSKTLLENNELIYYSLDSIKKGQIIIYREIRKTDLNDKTFFEKIKLILK
jgi:esterase/lipase